MSWVLKELARSQQRTAKRCSCLLWKNNSGKFTRCVCSTCVRQLYGGCGLGRHQGRSQALYSLRAHRSRYPCRPDPKFRRGVWLCLTERGPGVRKRRAANLGLIGALRVALAVCNFGSWRSDNWVLPNISSEIHLDDFRALLGLLIGRTRFRNLTVSRNSLFCGATQSRAAWVRRRLLTNR